MDIRDRIKAHEGIRLKPYRCPAGKLTIGWGHNLENGISGAVADLIFEEDFNAALKDVEGLFAGIPLTDARKGAMVDMRFQLGVAGFRAFKAMIAAVKAQDWTSVALECLDSDYARQCPVRAQENAADLESG